MAATPASGAAPSTDLTPFQVLAAGPEIRNGELQAVLVAALPHCMLARRGSRRSGSDAGGARCGPGAQRRIALSIALVGNPQTLADREVDSIAAQPRNIRSMPS